jgi:hypothetical protein
MYMTDMKCFSGLARRIDILQANNGHNSKSHGERQRIADTIPNTVLCPVARVCIEPARDVRSFSFSRRIVSPVRRVPSDRNNHYPKDHDNSVEDAKTERRNMVLVEEE